MEPSTSEKAVLSGLLNIATKPGTVAGRRGTKGSGGKGLRLAVLAAAGACVVVLVWSSHYQIEEGERGILLRQGAVAAVAEPGSGWLVPFAERIEPVSVRTHSITLTELRTYSSDQQAAMIDMTVVFHVPPEDVAQLYQQFGSMEEAQSLALEHQVARAMKETFSHYSAISAITDRTRLGTEVETAVSEAVMSPIVVDSVQLERIHFSEDYEKSIQERTVAEIAVLKAKQDEARAKVEAETDRISAQTKADSAMIAAQAEAGAIRLKGEAEADVLRQRAAALKDAPDLVGLIQAERWNGSLPQTMLPSGAVPMLDLRQGG